jgi:hypothetical protein
MAISKAAGFMMGMQAVTSIVNSYTASQSKKVSQDYESAIYDTNAYISQIQAQDAIKRGEEEARRIKERSRIITGAQRAAMAAQGIEVNEEDALKVQQDTAGLAAMDALDVKNNAWREAWGYSIQADKYSTASRFSKIRGISRTPTLITSGLNTMSGLAFDLWSQTKSGKSWSLKDIIGGT